MLTPLMVAETVGRSRRTVTYWIERGWLRATRAKNGWYWHIHPDDLDQFMKTCRNRLGDYLPQLWHEELTEIWNSQTLQDYQQTEQSVTVATH